MTRCPVMDNPPNNKGNHIRNIRRWTFLLGWQISYPNREKMNRIIFSQMDLKWIVNKFSGYLFRDWKKKKKFCRYLILQFGDCKTFHAYLLSRFQLKQKTKKSKSLNISFFIVNDTDMEELLLYWFSTKIHWNTRLAAADVFHMVYTIN